MGWTWNFFFIFAVYKKFRCSACKCYHNRLVLNTRDNTIADEKIVTATIYTSPCGFTDPTSTGITATVTGPVDVDTPNCLATGFGSVSATQGSLLSVQITTDSGALSSGVSATVFLTIP